MLKATPFFSDGSIRRSLAFLAGAACLVGATVSEGAPITLNFVVDITERCQRWGTFSCTGNIGEQLPLEVIFDDGITLAEDFSNPFEGYKYTYFGPPNFPGMLTANPFGGPPTFSDRGTLALNSETLFDAQFLGVVVDNQSYESQVPVSATERVNQSWQQYLFLEAFLQAVPLSPDFLVPQPSAADLLAWLGGSLGVPIQAGGLWEAWTNVNTCLQGSFLTTCSRVETGPTLYVEGGSQWFGQARLQAVSGVAIATPEPATLLLFGTGLAAAGVRRYRQRNLS
jgi:hypothetical protein